MAGCAAVWLSITWAADKIEKVERVPVLEQIVMQNRQQIALMQQRESEERRAQKQRDEQMLRVLMQIEERTRD